MSSHLENVLFVDDDLNLLSGLKRMLRSLRHEWAMEFVNSGDAALAHMAEHPIDVVVTDMRMPGMDGAELLREVSARHPGVIRIVLSGESNQESLMKVAGIAHQYLSKPCDTDTLKATVRRALTLRKHLGDETLKSLLAGLSSIPSLPTNYQEIMRELSNPEPSLAAIGDIIARDVAMTAKVLQLVNSAFFGIGRHVTSPAQAVKLLGLQTVNGLILSAGVFSQFSNDQAGPGAVDEVIEHSLRVAAEAKLIANRCSGDETVGNDAFVAGLLHDVGKLVLAMNYPNRYRQAIDASQDCDRPLYAVESQMFGASHAEIGGYLLELWGLPTALVEAVTFHHEPEKAQGKGFTALTAVHLADVLVNDEAQGIAHQANLRINTNYLDQIGMPHLAAEFSTATTAAQPAGAL